MEGQLACLTPRGSHDVDVRPRMIAIGGEGDVLAVGAPYGRAFIGRSGGEAASFPTLGRDRVDVALIGEGNGLAVG